MWTFIVVFVLLTAEHRAEEYQNTLRGVLHYVSPDKHVVSQVKSLYSSVEKDRQWKIESTEFGRTLNCSWSSLYSLHDAEFGFHCPANSVLTGMHSFYNRVFEDRSWSFRCCAFQDLITFNRRETTMVNYWSEDFDWQLPGGHFLAGVRTHNKNEDGDHRWSFNYCQGTTQNMPLVSSQILAANEQMLDLLTEGDVVLPNSRNARICSSCLWPKSSDVVEVPYVINSAFTSSERTTITDAMSGIDMATCIRFVPLSSQTDYISIVKDNGCYSYVGRTSGAQRVSLGTGCINNGIIQHELIHVLSFWHEHSRSDRDVYVRINFENIKEDNHHNFNQHETNNLDVPYDYTSVMHYGPKEFSMNDKDTITPLMSPVEIGQRIGMSDSDILKVNKLYQCNDYLHRFGDWDNQLLGTMTRQCPFGQAVSEISSVFNNDKKDRLWAFSCKAFQKPETCRWTDYQNAPWESINFKCRDNEVIAGAMSEFATVSFLADRKWKFYCCSVPGFTMSNCQTTPYVNYWRETFTWTVASDNFLTGVKASFNIESRDRRWSFTYCHRQ
ncbi:uncharacterized protein LOC117257266 [Epinephelus lanceolatus]|uniref:uncharacterized protein LOC117257266 n=1 Tax=Epinephelus lanceolatus TaxID=310571 RepID=UPI00144738AA|nr:uncharacterized protein LOC117257266 [Epinephelus lanceolatus]